TPFRGDGLDLEATERLVEFLIAGGTEHLVVSGSTGEAATCSVEERRSLWRFVKEHARGRVSVIAGTGTNSTSDSIALTKLAGAGEGSLHAALRRRLADPADDRGGSGRDRLGGRQRGPRADAAAHGPRPRRAHGRGGEDPRPALAPLQGAVRGIQSRARQVPA